MAIVLPVGRPLREHSELICVGAGLPKPTDGEALYTVRGSRCCAISSSSRCGTRTTARAGCLPRRENAELDPSRRPDELHRQRLPGATGAGGVVRDQPLTAAERDIVHVAGERCRHEPMS